MSTLAPGLNVVRALGNAIDRADLSLIDTAYLREVGGDKAERLIALATNMVNHVTTSVDNMVSEIEAKAGGQPHGMPTRQRSTRAPRRTSRHTSGSPEQRQPRQDSS